MLTYEVEDADVCRQLQQMPSVASLLSDGTYSSQPHEATLQIHSPEKATTFSSKVP